MSKLSFVPVLKTFFDRRSDGRHHIPYKGMMTTTDRHGFDGYSMQRESAP